jgi:hypothetical protein
MGTVRPGRSQVRVLHLEPKRAGATIGYAIMALLAVAVVVAALLYRTDSWPDQWRPQPDIPDQAPPIAAAAAGFFGLMFIGAAISNGRRWHIARVVERLSNDPQMSSLLPDKEWTPPQHRATTIPPLEVRVVRAKKLPKPQGKLRRVTADQNVLGHRPLHIAYLHLFENQPRMRTFMEGPWREFGYVYFLRSAESVTPSEYRQAKKSGDMGGLFISSRERLDAALGGPAVLGKGRYKFKTIGPRTIKVRDRYGGYSVRALLCHGTFWKTAVDVLLDRVDLVALDLSGFLPENVGTHYELQRVLDRIPVERVVFLADQSSDKKFLTAQLQEAWSQMSATSPNAGAEAKLAMVVLTDSISTQTHTTGGGTTVGPHGQVQMQSQTTQTTVSLVARRKETRRVAAMAQDRLDQWAAAGRTHVR